MSRSVKLYGPPPDLAFWCALSVQARSNGLSVERLLAELGEEPGHPYRAELVCFRCRPTVWAVDVRREILAQFMQPGVKMLILLGHSGLPANIRGLIAGYLLKFPFEPHLDLQLYNGELD